MKILAYYRVLDNQRILIVSNFGKETVSIDLNYPIKKILLSNMNRATISMNSLNLNSCEVLVLECDN